jgi:hypothetical protein
VFRVATHDGRTRTASLNLPGKSDSIYFTKRWFEHCKSDLPPLWQTEIHDEIVKGNTALIAIAEVSLDAQSGGFLQLKRTMRNSSTHTFSILHDIADSPRRESPYVDHYSHDAFIANLIETLQTIRAVLLYFVQMVSLHEEIRDDESPKAPLDVPDHDWIRGEDE